MKNLSSIKRFWKFDPNDKSLYTEHHVNKSRIEYINMVMGRGCLELLEEAQAEHFVTQFEGVLLDRSRMDRLIFGFLRFLDEKFPLLPQSQLLLFFKKR
jgi:hypothetical protein